MTKIAAKYEADEKAQASPVTSSFLLSRISFFAKLIEQEANIQKRVFDQHPKVDYRHVFLKISHVQIVTLTETLTTFEKTCLIVSQMRSSKTLHELLQPNEPPNHQSLNTN